MSSVKKLNPVFDRQIRIETHNLFIPKDASILAQQCGNYFQTGRYEEGIKLARQVDDFDHNAVAHRQVALGLAYKHEYVEARKYFTASMSLSADPHIWANCTANMGTTFLEEWELDYAEHMYEEALGYDPENIFGLLGRLAVACQRRDMNALKYAAAQLVDRISDWYENHIIVPTLLQDRSFRFLRRNPNVFNQIFGINLKTLTRKYNHDLATNKDKQHEIQKDIYYKNMHIVENELQSREFSVRRKMVKILEEVGSSEAIRILGKACFNEDFLVRQQAVEALSRIKNSQAIEALVEALSKNHTTIKRKIIRCLGKFENDQVIQVLTNTCTDDDPVIRREVGTALGLIDDLKVILALSSLCLHENRDIRKKVLDVVEALNNPKAIVNLIMILEQMKDSEAIEVFIFAMTSRSPILRNTVVETLEKSGSPLALRALVFVLSHGDNSVRERAVIALTKYHDKQAITGLAIALTDDDFGIRRLAAQAISGKLNAEDVQELYEKIPELANKDFQSKLVAFEALTLSTSHRAARRQALWDQVRGDGG